MCRNGSILRALQDPGRFRSGGPEDPSLRLRPKDRSKVRPSVSALTGHLQEKRVGKKKAWLAWDTERRGGRRGGRRLRRDRRRRRRQMGKHIERHFWPFGIIGLGLGAERSSTIPILGRHTSEESFFGYCLNHLSRWHSTGVRRRDSFGRSSLWLSLQRSSVTGQDGRFSGLVADHPLTHSLICLSLRRRSFLFIDIITSSSILF